MALRICLVTPFAWSQPHDVNEHVTGVATALRALGHSVTVLAPSNRARDRAPGNHCRAPPESGPRAGGGRRNRLGRRNRSAAMLCCLF